MKLAAKSRAAFISALSASSRSAGTRSILLMASASVRPCGSWSASASRIARTPSVSPRCASISSTTTSASAAPPQAALTIARSSRRRGRNRPGVSTKTSCAAPSMAMPRIRIRVVCTLWVTIETLAPTIRFKSVDLPAFGSPISATMPQRVPLTIRRLLPRVASGSRLAKRPRGTRGLALTPAQLATPHWDRRLKKQPLLQAPPQQTFFLFPSSLAPTPDRRREPDAAPRATPPRRHRRSPGERPHGAPSSRPSSASAAACCAARFEAARPSALRPSSSRASTAKTGAWSGPCRSRSR